MRNRNVGTRKPTMQREECILPEHQKLWILSNVYCLTQEIASILMEAVDTNKIACK